MNHECLLKIKKKTQTTRNKREREKKNERFLVDFLALVFLALRSRLELLLHLGRFFLLALQERVLTRVFVVAVDARVRAHLRAHDEIVQHPDPRVVTRQIIVKLGRDLSHL
jgi:hypothetical protein